MGHFWGESTKMEKYFDYSMDATIFSCNPSPNMPKISSLVALDRYDGCPDH